MKTHIFPNILLLIGGRIFLLSSIGMIPYLWILVFLDFSVDTLILLILLTIPLSFCEIWIVRFLYHQCFGEILVTEKEIIYFGLFLPTIRLKFERIKHVDIRTFDKGNVVYSKNSAIIDAHKFIIISENPLPNTRIDKIRPSRKRKLIKYAVSEKLCNALVDKLPERNKWVVETQLLDYKKHKKSQHSSR